MRTISIRSISIAASLVPGVAAAHPDHFSGRSFDLAHYLTDPFHVGLVGAAMLLFVAVSRSVYRRHATNRSAR